MFHVVRLSLMPWPEAGEEEELLALQERNVQVRECGRKREERAYLI